jgi:hypothetical protein
MFRNHAGFLERDAHTGGDRLPSEDTRFRSSHRHEYLFGDLDRTVNARDPFCQHEKLVSRYPGGDVRVVETTEESAGGDREDFFAYAPGIRGVGNHKRVHRHRQQREISDSFISSDRSPEVLEEGGPIEQSVQVPSTALPTEWVRMVSDKVSHTSSIDGSSGQLEPFRCALSVWAFGVRIWCDGSPIGNGNRFTDNRYHRPGSGGQDNWWRREEMP